MSIDSSKTMGPRAFIDATKVGGRQRLFVFLLFLIMVADGMDITIVSHLFPSLIRDWGATPAGLTAVVSGGVVGMAIGAISAGRAADRWGRKPVIIVCMLLAGFGTAALALAPGLEVFTLLRVMSCIGVGGVMPVALTLVADIVPTARRSQFVTLAFAGVPFGTIVGAYLAAAIIPSAAGWHGLVVAAGVLPLIVVLLFAIAVPESPSLLAARRAPEERIRSVLARLLPSADASAVDVTLIPEPAAAERGAFRTIMSRRLIVITILLWIYAFLGQGIQLLIQQFLPTLLQMPTPGLTTVESSLVVAMLGWGALVGVVLVSFVLKKADRFLTSLVLLLLGIVSLLAIGLIPAGFGPLMVGAFVLGLTLNPGIGLTNTLASLSYPTPARGTGVGTTNFVGRIGTLASGVAGGALIAAGFTLVGVFSLLAVPVAVLAVTVVGLRSATKHADREGDSIFAQPRSVAAAADTRTS